VKPGCSVLDYGCGSGILAIAAARLGAARVTGVDIDPQALRASAGNAVQNGVDVTFMHADALRMDSSTSSSRTSSRIRCGSGIRAHGAHRAGGAIALAGILAAQAADVCAVYTGSFDLAAWRDEDGWVLLSGRGNPT
jgi:ribosomal protein L11 methyltransferase